MSVDVMIPGPVGALSVRAKGLGAGPDRVVVCVQGSNLSGQTAYDFAFPGGDDYSVLDALVGHGFAAVTFAIRGYGASEAPADPLQLTTDHGIEDLAAVVEWLAGQGHAPVHLLGWSWGGRIAGRYVEQRPDRVDRLVLLDTAIGGGDLIPPIPTDPWWENKREYFAEHLEPEFTEPHVRAAFADHVLAHDRFAPNGIRMENAVGSIAIDPAKMTRPTLMIYGSEAAKQPYMHGSIARADFFEQMPTGDKALVIIPDCGDYAQYQRPRHRLMGAIAAFLRVG